MASKKNNIIIYFLIALFAFMAGAKSGYRFNKPSNIVRIDTVIKYKEIRDTIKLDSIVYKYKVVKDSTWFKKEKNKPDTTYAGLLTQYRFLGDSYFEKKYYSNTFKIGAYGTVTVNDTISENSLKYSELITNLIIPEKTIIKEVNSPIQREFYIGGHLTGNLNTPINGIYISPLLKTKKNNIHQLSIGYSKGLQFGIGSYWKIK